jgi:hypothetical protein
MCLAIIYMLLAGFLCDYRFPLLLPVMNLKALYLVQLVGTMSMITNMMLCFSYPLCYFIQKFIVVKRPNKKKEKNQISGWS